jgi:4-aminobutyrate aminotransferase-like enzyme
VTDPQLTSRHDLWAARDAAVVWHGFTQMSAYVDNTPIIVESAEGRELIDVDGRRYLDAISTESLTPRCSAMGTWPRSFSPKLSLRGYR